MNSYIASTHINIPANDTRGCLKIRPSCAAAARRRAGAGLSSGDNAMPCKLFRQAFAAAALITRGLPEKSLQRAATPSEAISPTGPPARRGAQAPRRPTALPDRAASRPFRLGLRLRPPRRAHPGLDAATGCLAAPIPAWTPPPAATPRPAAGRVGRALTIHETDTVVIEQPHAKCGGHS